MLVEVDIKDRDKRIALLEKAKEREARLIRKGWRWVQTDNHTMKLIKPDNND